MPVKASNPSTGTFQVLNGGFRNTANNSATGYAENLQDGLFQRATTSNFAAPFDLGPTDSNGAASATVSTGTWYARQKSAPTGWQSLSQLKWNNSVRDYTASASVTSGNTGTANIEGSNGDSTRFVQRLANPALPQGCDNGLKVLLLLDTSGSTSGHGNDYKSASNTFINTLAGTPTKLKISTFATTSSPGSTQYDLNTSGGQTDAHNRISNIYPSNSSGAGYTNWDQAFQDAGSAGVDVVVVVTDGNPTIHQGGSTNSSTGIADITYAIASANHAKNPGHVAGGTGSQTMMAVGVGGGIATDNLKAISGPNEGTDWTAAADPAALAQVLKDVASKICGGTLTVKKSLDPTTDPGLFDLKVNSVTKAFAVGNDGTSGKLNVDAGTYALTETAAATSPTTLADYNSKLDCVDKDGAVTVIDGKVEVKGNQDVTCTFTNTRKTGSLTVKKSLDPTTDPGLFDLKIDGTAYAQNVSHNGTTGSQTVAAGEHTVTETAGSNSPTALSDYEGSLACQDSQGDVASTDGKVQVADGQAVTCTFTNTRKTGTLTVKKSLDPTADPGLFDLKIDGTAYANNVGHDGTTGAQTVVAGEHTVTETAGSNSPTAITDYNSKLACQDKNGPVVVGQDGKLDVDGKQAVTCTFTNTRKTGTIAVKKSLDPTTDPGLFDLKIDGTAYAQNVGHNGTTGDQTVAAGEHTVTETAGSNSPTALSDYNAKLACQDAQGDVASTDGKVQVADGQAVTCTFTNTRKTGSLTVKKSLDPTADPGLFDLKIDGTAYAQNVSHNGTTGDQTVVAGEHTVTETTGSNSPTTLSDYNAKLACEDKNGPVTSTDGKVQVADSQAVTCTFTNTRKAGSLTVKKSLDPTTDPGLFDLKIDGTTYAQNVSHNGTTGDQYAVAGEHAISETAGSNSPTALTDYNSKLACQDKNGPVASTDGKVQVADGQAITCTFTNTRKTGSLTVKKSLDPTADPGLFDLKIDGTAYAQNVGHNGNTGDQTVVAGEHTVTETAGSNSPTTLSDYNSKLACQDAQGDVASTDGKVQVADGQSVTCTFTNTRKTGTLTVKKSLDPTADPGLFDLKIDGTAYANNVGHNGTTGAQTVVVGEHTVTETAGSNSPTTLSDYNAKLACQDTQGNVESEGGKVQVADGQAVTCTFTNTRIQFPLSANVIGNGTVTSNPTGIDCGVDCNKSYNGGSKIVLTATPASGQKFVGWSNDCSGSASTCNVTMDQARKVTATFEPVALFPLDAAVVGSGTINSNPNGISCPGTCVKDWSENSKVTLTAAPSSGWVFQGWTGDCSGAISSCQVTMSQSRSVQAIFAQVGPIRSFTLRVQVHNRGQGRVETTKRGINCLNICYKPYPSGRVVAFKQHPKRGYYFLRWGGSCKGRGRCVVRMNRPRSVHAYYRKKPTSPRFTG